MTINLKNSLSTSLLAILLFLGGCAGFNDPYYTGGNSSYNGYDSDYYNDRERYELERERRRLEEERRRLEREREREQDHWDDHHNHNPPQPVPRPTPVIERCPSGFTPSENRCSDKERKRGCRDIRLPSGQGCVRR